MSGKKLINQSQGGFTLVELLVVVTLTIMLMLTASTLFMTYLVGNSKTNSVALLKAEGNYALKQMEFLLRNSVDLVPNALNETCATNMDSIAIKSLDGRTTTLSAKADPNDNNLVKIASSSGTRDQFLTSSGVTIESGPIFNCTPGSDNTSPFITINFTLRKGVPSVDEARDITTQDFTTGVSIRNY